MQLMPSNENNLEKQGKNPVITYFPFLSITLGGNMYNIIQVTNRNTAVHLVMEGMQTV